MKKNGFGFLSTTSDQRDDDEPQGGKVTASSGSAACGAAMAPWSDKPLYPSEQRLAETRGKEEPIYKLTTRTVRIQTDREDMSEKAVWLAVGRPGFLAFKEDEEGQVMDWTDPFCLLCGAFATYDHVGATKHVEKTKTAAGWASSRGYDEVVDWIEKNSQEVIDIANTPAATRPRQVAVSSDSDEDSCGPGFGESAAAACANWPFDIMSLPFAEWPFALLEVDLSTKKLKDHWGPMDPEMAEAIRREAQKGKTHFEISLMVKKVAWVYKIDFLAWTRENLESGTVRKLRFAVA